MGFFERYLTVWVFLCIAAGIGLGQLFPGFFQYTYGLSRWSWLLPSLAVVAPL
jgi:ACR3 family arsenite efflux pump ArsB